MSTSSGTESAPLGIEPKDFDLIANSREYTTRGSHIRIGEGKMEPGDGIVQCVIPGVPGVDITVHDYGEGYDVEVVGGEVEYKRVEDEGWKRFPLTKSVPFKDGDPSKIRMRKKGIGSWVLCRLIRDADGLHITRTF